MEEVLKREDACDKETTSRRSFIKEPLTRSPPTAIFHNDNNPVLKVFKVPTGGEEIKDSELIDGSITDSFLQLY